MTSKAFIELNINGGHTKKVLRSLDKMLNEIHSDVPGLLFSYFKTRNGKKIKNLIDEKFFNTFLAKIRGLIRNCHTKVPNHQKSQWLSLVAHTFTRKELVEKYGFGCSARAFANARNHAEEHYPGASSD
jgi:hypothetical protein